MGDDIGIWEEAVRFAEGENPDFVENNWPNASLLETYKFNFVIIKDRDGNDLYAEYYDYLNGRPYLPPEGFSDFFDWLSDDVIAMYEQSAPYTGDIADLGRGGIFFFDDVPYFGIAMPIMPQREDAHPAGTVILGNILTDDYFRDMTNFETMSFDIESSRGGAYLSPQAITRGDNTTVQASITLNDINGNPLLLVVKDNRIIYTEGQNMLIQTTFWLIVAMVAFVVVLYLIIVRLALKPVEQLSADIQNIGSIGAIDISKYSDNSEFFTLTSSINDMLEGLRQSRISLDVFQSILDGMDAYLYVTDPKTDEILFINNKMKEHYSLPDNIVGMTCWQVLQEGFDHRCDFCPNEALLQHPDTVVTWEEHSSVTGRYYRNNDSLIRWADGRLVHLQHSIDVTDIKNAELALQQRLEQQELMSDMAQGFISTDDMSTLIGNALKMTGEFLHADKIIIAALNEDKTELTYQYGWHCERPDVPPIRGAAMPFAEGQVIYDEFLVKQSEYLAVEDTAGKKEYEYLVNFGVKSFLSVPIYVGGEFWGIINLDSSTCHKKWADSDVYLMELISSLISGVITRNETEEMLIRLSSIVNSSPQYITYLDSQGNLAYVNPGAEAMTGYTADELRQGGFPLIFDDESLQKVKELIYPGAYAGKNFTVQLPIIRKDGQRRILEFSVFVTGSEKLGQGAIASDITEKIQLEQALISAKDQAEASNRAKSDFLSRMSHEMRTPMNAIIGMTSIAKSASSLDRKDYCLDKIDDASIHLLGVINDILGMSKIEAGKFDLSFTEFNVEKMLIKVANVVNFRVDEKQQDFVVHVDKSIPPSIVSDEQRLTQVLTNLLSNAVKFTPEHGTITLHAEKTEETDGSCTLRFNVTDTGIGISKEQQTKLFRSFEQADGSISRKYGGTGLGLAISRRIVEMMDGEIWVESAP